MSNQHIFDNPEMLYKAAADQIVALSKSCIAKKGKFTIALSGGSTPRKLYELLAQPYYTKSLDWKNIFVFWGDERCVPLSDVNNNAHMASLALLNNVPIPAENIFPIPVNFKPERAANSYEQTIKTFFKKELPGFDLILLGLGENGHTASLFPFTDILKESKKMVKEVLINKPDTYRISFTAGLINNAAHILFLVTGKEKADIINTIFSSPKNPEKYPVQLIRPAKGKVEWFLDKAAAKKLKK